MRAAWPANDGLERRNCIITVPELLEDPAWLPIAFSADYSEIQFGRVTRQSLSNHAFLDHRLQPSITAQETCAVTELVNALDDERSPPPAFIFHSAFCCSTLLARALDESGTALSLKEPNIVMDLANFYRVLPSAQHDLAMTRTVVALLARRFDAREAVVVKPTNAANNLLPYCLQLGARVLVLYGDLRSFLVSVLKKGEECKAFIRGQYNIFGLDPGGLAKIDARKAMTFTDLQVATLVWRHQLELFTKCIGKAPAEQLRSLDFHQLTSNPHRALRAVTQHLQLPHDEDTLSRVVNGPVFATNSKFADEQYNSEARASDARATEEKYADELQQILGWAESLALEVDIPMPLGNTLTL